MLGIYDYSLLGLTILTFTLTMIVSLIFLSGRWKLGRSIKYHLFAIFAFSSIWHIFKIIFILLNDGAFKLIYLIIWTFFSFYVVWTQIRIRIVYFNADSSISTTRIRIYDIIIYLFLLVCFTPYFRGDLMVGWNQPEWHQTVSFFLI